MASFTGVGDNTSLTVANRGETVAIAISGTYNMTIALQRNIGSSTNAAWEEIKRWSTANATVAYDYVTRTYNESVRLIVLVDTSGTATATLTSDLTNSVLTHHSFRDEVGNQLLDLTDAGAKFFGGIQRTSAAIVDETSATLTVTADQHAGRTITLNRAAGVTCTLPAATGTGNVYTFFTETTVTSNANVIQAASSSDIIQGGVAVSTDAGGVTILAAATSDTISQNGSTTGGVKGSWVRLTDVASGIFMCEGFLVSTGAEATPFSAAV